MEHEARTTIDNLEAQLAEQRSRSASMRTAEERALQEEAVEVVAHSGLVDHSLTVGDRAPDFSLPDAAGKTVELSTLLESGPVVISFYRGGWCPYCNLELRALQLRLDDIHAAGAELVAISPELPDSSLDTVEKNELNFAVLSDVGNRVARSFGLVHSISAGWVRYQLSKGIDVAARNGSDEAEVPVPATYVVAMDGSISFAFADPDYTRRPEPQRVIDAVLGLRHGEY